MLAHQADGMKGWKHWHCNGDRIELENPAWREALAEYVKVGEDGSIKLNVDSALRLAYVHSPPHRTQLETLYLSALDVTAERFRLDAQFFGGYDVRYAHSGSMIPAGLAYDPVLGRYVAHPAVEGPGIENSRLTVGRPFAADPAIQARRRFATAGDLLVGFANSFVFEFAGRASTRKSPSASSGAPGRRVKDQIANRKSGDTLLVSLLSRATPFLWFEHATDKTLQTLQERLISERSARATVRTQRFQLLFS